MTLSKTNNLLLGTIILINLYIILAPLVPILLFELGNHHHLEQQLSTQISSHSSRPQSNPLLNQGDSLVVPSMQLNQPILEGPVANQYKILDKGIWRWPKGSTPDKGSNTILIGHRYTYTDPQGVFYFLNKIRVGDEFAIIWNHKQYRYKTVSLKEVSPSDTTIEKPSKRSEVTLFTCTPLWFPKDRLVVVAVLENGL